MGEEIRIMCGSGTQEPCAVMTEEWRAVPSCPGYFASNLGRVRGTSGRIVSGCLTQGYLRTAIREGGMMRTVSHHSMVMEAFVGPRPAGYDIDHLDRKRSNNALSNLRYVTHAENMSTSVQPNKGLILVPRTTAPRAAVPRQPPRSRPSRRKENRANAVLTAEQAREILELPRPSGNTRRGRPHPNSINSIAKRYGVSRGAILHLLSGRTWAAARGAAHNPPESPKP